MDNEIAMVEEDSQMGTQNKLEFLFQKEELEAHMDEIRSHLGQKLLDLTSNIQNRDDSIMFNELVSQTIVKQKQSQLL
jgi:hypothetical protein